MSEHLLSCHSGDCAGAAAPDGSAWQVLQGLADPERQVRRTVGTCVATLAKHLQAGNPQHWLQQQWPGLLPTLVGGLQSPDAAAVDGCLDCLLKMNEEDGVAEAVAAEPSQPLAAIVPKLFELFSAAEPRLRATSAAGLNQIYALRTPFLDTAAFLQARPPLVAAPAPHRRRKAAPALRLAGGGGGQTRR